VGQVARQESSKRNPGEKTVGSWIVKIEEDKAGENPTEGEERRVFEIAHNDSGGGHGERGKEGG